MMRQVFFRVMLSLLLLVSQQMATAHALSHWSSNLDQSGQIQVQDKEDLSSSFAQDQTCNQCLAFAQLAVPVGCAQRTFAAPDLGSMAIASQEAHSAIARTRVNFRSRAPPQA